MNMAISLSTEDKLEYTFHPVSSTQIQFRVKAPNDAHVALTTGPNEGEPMFEVFIGGWGNGRSVVRKNRTKPEMGEAETPGILSTDEFRGFWIRWNNGALTMGKEGEHSPILDVHDPDTYGIRYFGVCTGWGACGEWLIEARCVGDYGGHPNIPQPSAPAELNVARSVCWSDATGGNLPSGAVEGGRDVDGPLYIGRASHGGALIPGKVNLNHGVCYVAWGGEEHGKSEYQILCGCTPRWVAVTGDNIPPNAIPSGETEDGEPLFVGRVAHEGTQTIGKVQASHGVCYIPFGGAELSFPEYEILVEQ